MARTPTILQSEFPYHVGARCINREWFTIPLPEVWELSCDLLWFVQTAFNLNVHSYLLMSNHFHLIVSTPNANISEAMAYFLREFTREINRRTGRINQAFGDRFFKCVLNSNHYFGTTYKYVYQNPVRAGICDRVEDYTFSTIRGLIGIDKITVPVVEDTLLFEHVEGTLAWLNKKSTDENYSAIRDALKKPQFKLRKQRGTGKPHPLESESL